LPPPGKNPAGAHAPGGQILPYWGVRTLVTPAALTPMRKRLPPAPVYRRRRGWEPAPMVTPGR